MLNHAIFPAFHEGVNLYRHTIRHPVNTEFTESRNCVPMAFTPRVRRHRFSSPQGSSSSGCCFSGFTMSQFFMRLSFPHLLLVCSGHDDMCDKVSIGGGMVMYGHREFGLERQVRPSRPASACSFFTLRLSLVLTRGRCLLAGFPHFPRRRQFIYTANRHRVSPEFIISQNYVPMAFTVESPPAQGRKSSRKFE